MSPRQIGLSLLAVVVAVVLQTTLFARVRPFDVSPDLVLLTVIACARWIEPEPAVLLGFTGGLLIDLFGSAPLGLQALAMTLVALAAVRTRDRYAYNFVGVGAAVAVFSFMGILLVAIIGTLFGQGTLSDPDIVRVVLLVPLFNLVLSLGVLPLIGSMVGDGRPTESVF